jgi:hypothetical protein
VIDAVFLPSTDSQESGQRAPEEAQHTLAQLQKWLIRNQKLDEMLCDRIRNLHREDLVQNPAMVDMEIIPQVQNWNPHMDLPAAEFYDSTSREATTIADHLLPTNLNFHQLNSPNAQLNQISVNQRTQSQALISVWNEDQRAFDQLQAFDQGTTADEALLFNDSGAF